MRDNTVAGERGRVVWKASITGFNQQVTYDSCLVRFALVVPLSLGGVFHLWDIPALKVGGPCRAIPLRPDAEFPRRVVVGTLAGLAAAVVSFGLFLLALKLFVDMTFVPAGAVMAVAVVVAVFGFWYTRKPASDARHRDIRLLLGSHEWGTSDPATWSDELAAVVVEPSSLGVQSFAELSKRESAAGRWGEAMWAARLSTAVEDEATGESLTDAILADPEVATRLRAVRRRPDTRDEQFGPAPGLQKWITADPDDYVVAIG